MREQDEAETVQKPDTTTMQDPSMTTTQEPSMPIMKEPAMTTRQDPRMTIMQETGMLTVLEPGMTTMPEPATATMQEPGMITMQEPGETTLQEPSMTTMKEPGTQTIQEPGMEEEMLGQAAAEIFQDPGMTTMQEQAVAEITQHMLDMNTRSEPEPSSTAEQAPSLNEVQEDPTMNCTQERKFDAFYSQEELLVCPPSPLPSSRAQKDVRKNARKLEKKRKEMREARMSSSRPLNDVHTAQDHNYPTMKVSPNVRMLASLFATSNSPQKSPSIPPASSKQSNIVATYHPCGESLPTLARPNHAADRKSAE